MSWMFINENLTKVSYLPPNLNNGMFAMQANNIVVFAMDAGQHMCVFATLTDRHVHVSFKKMIGDWIRCRTYLLPRAMTWLVRSRTSSRYRSCTG
jgi:hypothetical protein